MKALLAIEMETGDLADYEPGDEGRRMNKKQIERAAGVRDAMNERAAKQKVRIETRNEMNAKAIYNLQQEVMEQAKRIEKLEVALREVAP